MGKVSKDSYFHGGSVNDAIHFTKDADLIETNSSDYINAFKPTNKALTLQGDTSNISSVSDSYFEELKTFTHEKVMTLFI